MGGQKPLFIHYGNILFNITFFVFSKELYKGYKNQGYEIMKAKILSAHHANLDKSQSKF